MSTSVIAQNSLEILLQRLYNFLTSFPILRWFISKGYAQGIFWALMISVFSSTNDVLMCHLGNRLHVVEISFFRFLFTMLTVLPLMLYRGKTFFLTKQPMMHFWRAIIGAAALGLCCFSVNIMPMSENTTIMFAEPLFFLPLAFFLLREKVDRARWAATIVGFVGLLIILQPGTDTFRLVAFVPMTAAFLFAVLNILAKKMIADEHSFTLLFYFGLGTTLIAAIPLPFFWQMPSMNELFWLCLLGIGGNMIQVSLFRAFTATDASALAPLRYGEFIVSAVFGFLFFQQIPTWIVLMGALIISASTFYITVVERRKEKAQPV